MRDDAASGSGCLPGAEALPAGWWYGTIGGVRDGALRFDLACYYWGPAAEAAAASEGDPFWNDHYVVNDNPQLRVVPVATAATASCVVLKPQLGNVECAPGQVSGGFGVDPGDAQRGTDPHLRAVRALSQVARAGCGITTATSARGRDYHGPRES